MPSRFSCFEQAGAVAGTAPGLLHVHDPALHEGHQRVGRAAPCRDAGRCRAPASVARSCLRQSGRPRLACPAATRAPRRGRRRSCVAAPARRRREASRPPPPAAARAAPADTGPADVRRLPARCARAGRRSPDGPSPAASMASATTSGERSSSITRTSGLSRRAPRKRRQQLVGVPADFPLADQPVAAVVQHLHARLERDQRTRRACG